MFKGLVECEPVELFAFLFETCGIRLNVKQFPNALYTGIVNPPYFTFDSRNPVKQFKHAC